MRLVARNFPLLQEVRKNATQFVNMIFLCSLTTVLTGLGSITLISIRAVLQFSSYLQSQTYSPNPTRPQKSSSGENQSGQGGGAKWDGKDERMRGRSRPLLFLFPIILLSPT